MAVRKTVAVNARELRDAFDFVSAGEAFDHSACISLDTGRIYWRTPDADLEEDDLPDDIEYDKKQDMPLMVRVLPYTLPLFMLRANLEAAYADPSSEPWDRLASLMRFS